MEGGRREPNWSEDVEDLVDRGDVDGAVALLESLVAGLGNSDASPGDAVDGDLRLAAALGDLAHLHASRGCSLQADELRARALLLRDGVDHARRAPSLSSLPSPAQASRDSEQVTERVPEREDPGRLVAAAALDNDDNDDDWEAFADRSLLDTAGVSSCQPEDEAQIKATTKRRGRGCFLYKKDGLYSDQRDVGGISVHSDSDEESDRQGRGETTESSLSRLGTRHVLVLYDFPPSTCTTELEKPFEGFRDHGFAIRWVHDTCALAVFRSPSIADQARNIVRCPFKIRPIDENDKLLSQISTTDLEPSYPRPKTSARTAQRLIAQGMGLKLRTDFGSRELRIQEAARKDRIQSRQVMRDDAWGPDDP